MLTEAQNRALAEVGAGTAMGELLRRYWQPIAAVSEFEDQATRPVRLMGEDLVLYKDKHGTYGLVDRHCPHRRADLSYGFVEERGLRCNYHGWLYDETGACIHQPFEEIAHPDAKFKERIHIKAYPVEAKAGLLWAYMGPLPAPLLPDWEAFSRENGFVQIVLAEIPCNWFQCQENSIDPVHFEWLHDTWTQVLTDTTDAPRPTSHLKLNFVEFEHGFQYQRVREGQSEGDELWTVGRVCLFPHGFYLGGHFEWRVPVDDDHTLSVLWCFDHVPTEMEPYRQERIPSWVAPLKDEQTGRWITSHIVNQDFVAWVGQGDVADRTQEHLGESDKGVILLRRRLLEEAEKVQQGLDPIGTLRDPRQNRAIVLPTIGLSALQQGRPFNEVLVGARRRQLPGQRLGEFPYFAFQPDEIRQEYLRAMGLDRVIAEEGDGLPSRALVGAFG